MSDLPMGQRRGRTRVPGRNKRSTGRKPYLKFANTAVAGDDSAIVAEHQDAAAEMAARIAQLPVHAGDVVRLTDEAIASPDNADLSDDERALLAAWRGTVTGVRLDDDTFVADFESEDETAAPLDVLVVVDADAEQAEKDRAAEAAKATEKKAAEKKAAAAAKKAAPAGAQTKVVAPPKQKPQDPATTAQTK